MVTINYKADYLKQELEWVEQRLEALDEIEQRLMKMRELAEYARDNDIGYVEAQEINGRLQAMQEEIKELDDRSKVFRLEGQLPELAYQKH
jgi:prefoldin subunit 5